MIELDMNEIKLVAGGRNLGMLAMQVLVIGALGSIMFYPLVVESYKCYSREDCGKLNEIIGMYILFPIVVGFEWLVHKLNNPGLNRLHHEIAAVFPAGDLNGE